MIQKTTLFFFFLICSQSLQAQFLLNGDAIQINDSCFRLTREVEFKAGSIWFEEKINLNESFDVLMNLNFGCLDASGADGIVFGLQPVGTSIGSSGEGIGFLGVSPSIAVEFDTWQNGNLSDPSFDHIAIIQNGNVNHNSINDNLAGPVSATANASNIEDCEYHQMLAQWDAPNQTLTVFFDCSERLSYTGDIVNDIFNGNPEVFWGFTAATGGSVNEHEVCFVYSTILDGFLEDVTICPNGQYQLQVGGGDSYLWSPTEGLSDATIPNPIASPSETTTYVVAVLDECNIPLYDTITIFVEGDTVRFDLGSDTTFCEPNTLVLDADNGSPSTYLWSDGNTQAIREVSQTGLYKVTATLDDACITESDIRVIVLPVPSLNFPNDTILCLETSLLLDATIDDSEATYLWSDGSEAPILMVKEEGNYSVSINNICGETQALIQVKTTDCQSLYIPSAFSPNDDGINDVFRFFSDGDIQEIRLFQIYDRWGNLLFSKSGLVQDLANFAWDGWFRGKPMSAGVYTWMLQVVYRDGIEETLGGDVTLLH